MITVYVLQLEHGCFYVGQSSALKARLEAHFRRKASAWTRAHPPIELLSHRVLQTTDKKEAELVENEMAFELMRTYGWQRVRGGFFCATSEEQTRKNLLHHERHVELAVSRPLEQPLLGFTESQ